MNLAAEGLLGIALGASLSVPPGPMNAWIAGTSARSYRSGVATGLGAMTADAVLGVVVYASGRLVDLEALLRFVFAVGAGTMAYFAWRSVRRPQDSIQPTSELGTFARAVALGLTNPYQILWWLTAGLAFVYLGGAALLAGLFGAIALWVVGFPAVVRAGAQRSERVGTYIRWVSGAAMAAFAAYFALLALGT